VVSQPNADVRTDHVPGHGRSVPLSCCATRAPPQSTGMSSPLIAVDEDVDCACSIDCCVDYAAKGTRAASPHSFEEMAVGMGRSRLLEAMEGWNDATAGL